MYVDDVTVFAFNCELTVSYCEETCLISERRQSCRFKCEGVETTSSLVVDCLALWLWRSGENAGLSGDWRWELCIFVASL